MYISKGEKPNEKSMSHTVMLQTTYSPVSLLPSCLVIRDSFKLQYNTHSTQSNHKKG